MEYSVNTMVLLSYAIPKQSGPRYTKTFKRLLPRKKSSSMRIGRNHQWNLLEESCQNKSYHFINLNFNNEINDNIVNGNRERNSKRMELEKCSKIVYDSLPQTNVFHENEKPSSNLLTPPFTPQVGHKSFHFNMEQKNLNKTSLCEMSEVDGLPLTPSDSEVFSY